MSEQSDQIALFDFLVTMEGRYPLLSRVFHPANEASGGGKKRTVSYQRKDGSQGYRAIPIEAFINAQMGVKPGVPDIWAPFKNRAAFWGYDAGVFVGLVVEQKCGNGQLSTEQEGWRDFLRSEGWAFATCYRWTETARLLLTWVGGDPEEVRGL